MIALYIILSSIIWDVDAGMAEKTGYCVVKNCPSEGDMTNFKKSLTGTITYKEIASVGDWYSARYVKNHAYITEPAIVVYAETEDDVRASVLFGKKYNYRLSFLSSGHDYIGRSTGDKTLMVRMNKMKNLTIFPKDNNSPTGSTMIAETGANWGEVYQAVDKYNLLAVGGAAHGVAMGGWFLGGGHSPLSRKLGLGVDQIISFRGVLPDGNLANISAEGIKYDSGKTSKDTDLFWALRGGGGSTFAIITQFYFQLHPVPAGGFVALNILFPWFHNIYGEVGSKILNFWNNLLATKLTDNWGGYVMWFRINDVKNNVRGSVLFFLVHYGPMAVAKASIKPLLDFHPEWRIPGTTADMKAKATFWEYSKASKDDLNGNSYIINKLIQPKDLTGDFSNMAHVMKTSFDEYPTLPIEQGFGCTSTTLGKKTTEPSTTSTAIHPSFRTALMSLSCGVGWTDNKGRDWMKNVLKKVAKRLYTLEGGVYLNEPDYDLANWSDDYWGSNYEKLLSIKTKYDPSNTFTCLHCVGGSTSLKPGSWLLIIVTMLKFVL